jgi:predicted phosphodiesterase
MASGVLRRAAGLGLLLCCAAARLAAGEFTTEPYLQNPGKTEVTLKWAAAEKAEFKVRYGALDRRDLSAPVAECREVVWKDWPGGKRPADAAPEAKPTEERKAYIYKAVLTGLPPGSACGYEVTCGTAKAGGTFRTVPEKPAPFTFIAYGDNRTDAEAHRKVAARFAAHGPAFIIHTGDMVTDGSYPEWEPQFFAPLREVLRGVPLWPALGNHDGDYRKFFAVPPGGQSLWYSFDYGDAHFVSLDTMSNKPDMLGWCERDLAGSRARWKIVFYHLPSYDVGSHGTRWGLKNYLPAFRKHGVDLVLGGHTHSYQRFKPMFTKGENEAHPITHVITAGGGAPLHAVAPDSFLAASAESHHYLVVTVDAERLAAKAFSPEGRELDSFELVKKDGALAPEVLKAAVAEDDFDLVRKLVRPYLRDVRLEGEVRAGAAGKVRFKLGAGEKAGKFTVAIESRAERLYRMAAVSGDFPAGGAADVELAPQLRDAAPYRDAKVPLPPLMIECTLDIGGWRTGLLVQVRVTAEAPPAGE